MDSIHSAASLYTLSFKERAGVRMGLLQDFETHPHLNPPLEGEERRITFTRK
jgi:hypothetical protein